MYDALGALLVLLGRSLLYVLPAYFSNGAPVLFGGGRPIDGGRRFWDGKPIFGPRKTIRGFVSGVLVGLLTGFTIGIVVGEHVHPKPDAASGFLMGLGAMTGDLVGSFIKRRLNKPPGSPTPGLDQLDFLIGAIAFSSAYAPPPIDILACALVLTPFIHLLTSYGAYKLGLKKEPW